MNKLYYIYHIPGVKIGCSETPHIRVKKKRKETFEILEIHTDILIASDREMALQKQYGYRVDSVPYWMTVKIGSRESTSKGGKVASSLEINAYRMKVQCPHCGKWIQKMVSTVHHFDNCKSKV